MDKDEMQKRIKEYSQYQEEKRIVILELQKKYDNTIQQYNELIEIAESNFEEGYELGLLRGTEHSLRDFEPLAKKKWAKYEEIIKTEILEKDEKVSFKIRISGCMGDPDDLFVVTHSIRLIFDWENYKRELIDLYTKQQKERELKIFQNIERKYLELKKSQEILTNVSEMTKTFVEGDEK